MSPEDSEDPFIFYNVIHKLCKFTCTPSATEENKGAKVIRIIILSSTYVIFLYCTLKAHEDVQTLHALPRHAISLYFDIFVLYANLSTFLHMLYFTHRNYHKTTNVLRKLREFDKTMMHHLSCRFRSRKRGKLYTNVFVCLFLFAMGCCVCRMIMYWVVYSSIQWHTVSYAILCYFQCCILIQYVFMLSQLCWRFIFLNEYIHKLNKDMQVEKTSVFSIRTRERGYVFKQQEYQISTDIRIPQFLKIKKVLKLFKILHLQLCDVTNCLSDTFGMYHAHLLLHTYVVLVVEIFSMYLMAKFSIGGEYSVFGSSIAHAIFNWYLNGVYQFMGLFYMSDWMQKEVMLILTNLTNVMGF